jgi:hypothetical protein
MQSVAQSKAKCNDNDDSDGWSNESVDSVVVVRKEKEIENPPEKVQTKPQVRDYSRFLFPITVIEHSNCNKKIRTYNSYLSLDESSRYDVDQPSFQQKKS